MDCQEDEKVIGVHQLQAQLVMKSEKYMLGYKQTLKMIRQRKAKLIILVNDSPALRKSGIEYYAMLAKVGMYHYSGNNIELGTACGLFTAVASANISPYAIWQFRKMIMCVDPSSSPILDYNDYGCNCGFGGTGTYVDELDKCCLNHDKCYIQAKKDHCRYLIDSPYIELYDYSCSEKNVICSDKNNSCENDLCNCDRTAAICFSHSKYKPENKNLDRNRYC
ncbi:phospholipase A2-like [Carcharodon carcharias]|uniref:phospholipase A2-like n=1 Tax=Carcharodon carcharias TaxID=13397 RepID=UPI001B7EC59F|nr:phospholipase A2-like [Carcharodon carcharias]